MRSNKHQGGARATQQKLPSNKMPTPNAGGAGQSSGRTDHRYEHLNQPKKQVTFNQQRLSSQDNASSDRYSSKNSKNQGDKRNSLILNNNNGMVNALDSHGMAPNEKAGPDTRAERKGQSKAGMNQIPVNRKSGGGKQQENSKANAQRDSQKGQGQNDKHAKQNMLNSRNMQQAQNSDLYTGQVNAQVNPTNAYINSNIENLSVGMEQHDDTFDQFVEFNEFENVYGSTEGEVERMSDKILQEKKSKRLKQMQKRYDIIKQQESKDTIQEEVPSDQVDADSVKSAKIEDEVPSVMQDDIINEIEDLDCPNVQEDSPRPTEQVPYAVNDYTAKPIEQDQTVSILKNKTGAFPNTDKERNERNNLVDKSKIRKQVSISEDQRTDGKVGKLAGPGEIKASQAQSDGTFLSVSSFDDKLGLNNENRSNNFALDRHSDNSIISEEESAFEEATPAANKRDPKKMNAPRMDIDVVDFGAAVGQFNERSTEQQRKSSHSQKRGLTKSKKSMSIHKEDHQIKIENIDDPKAKPHRMQTMGRTNQTNQRDISPSIKSKGVLTNVDQESLRSLKFLSNKNQRQAATITRKKRDSAAQGFTQADKINMQNNNYKKQATQDEKRHKNSKYTEQDKDSRNNSLNLTVDNQLDMLSVNFGNKAAKFGQRNMLKEHSTERRAENQRDGQVQGTFSVISGMSKMDANQKRDLILAQSKPKIDPRSNQRFQRQISNDSRYHKSRGLNSPYQRSTYQRCQEKSQFSGSRKSGDRDRELSMGWEKYKIFANQTGLPLEDENDPAPKQQKRGADIIGIYMKAPYKVMSISKIKQRERDLSGSRIRLFKAENNLNVHTVYNRYNQTMSTSKKPTPTARPRIQHRQVQIEKFAGDKLSNDHVRSGQLRIQDSNANSAKHLAYGTARNEQEQLETQEHADEVRRINEHSVIMSNMSDEQINYANNLSVINAAAGSQAAQYVESSNATNTGGPGQDLAGEESAKGKKHSFKLNLGNQNLKQSQGFLESASRAQKAETKRQEQEFKIRFYDELLFNLDRQCEALSGHVQHLKKKQDLCNIYGQTFQAIYFGDASYTIGTQNPAQNSPRDDRGSKDKSSAKKKQKPLNEDILRPLGEQLRNSQRNKTQKFQHTQINKKLSRGESPLDCRKQNSENPQIKMSLSNLQDLMISDQILAESARVKKEIIGMEEDVYDGKDGRGSILTPRSPEDTATPAGLRHASAESRGAAAAMKTENSVLQNIAPDSSRDCERSADLTDPFSNTKTFQLIQEAGYFTPQTAQQLSQLSSTDQLKALLQMSNTMGYSHQQLKLIKAKYKLIEATEQELERLMKKIKRQEMAGSAYVQKAKKGKNPYEKQLTGHSYDFNQKKHAEAIQEFNQQTFDSSQIKTYYPQPGEAPIKVKNGDPPSKSKEKGSPLKNAASKQQSMIQYNKLNYALRISQMRSKGASKMKQDPGDHVARSNDNSALDGSLYSKKYPLANNQKANQNLNTSIDNEEASVKDYFGNKISLRRSIEHMNYETKQFKKNQTGKIFNSDAKDQMNSGEGRAQQIRASQAETASMKSKNASYAQNTNSLDKPKFDYIKQNRKNILPFSEYSVNLQGAKDSGFKTPTTSSQLPHIIAQSQSSKKNNQIEKKNRNHPFAKTQKQKDAGNLNVVPELAKQINKTTTVIDKLKSAEDTVKDKAASQFQHKKTASQVVSSKISQYQSNPPIEEKSPIRKQRSRVISDTKSSRTRLIQSGQHIISKQYPPAPYSGYSTSGANIAASNAEIAKLGYQFKNISPRLPQFQHMHKKNQDIEKALAKMKNANINLSLKEAQRQAAAALAAQEKNQAQNAGNAPPSNYGQSIIQQNLQHASKQTQILKGVLTQQRRLNRLISNNGLMGSGPANLGSGPPNMRNIKVTDAAVSTREILRQGHNNSIGQTSRIGGAAPYDRSLLDGDSYRQNPQGYPISRSNVNQSVQDPHRQMVQDQQTRNGQDNLNQFTTLDPVQQQRHGNVFIPNIQSGTGDLIIGSERENNAARGGHPQQQMSTIKSSSMNAPGQ